MMTTIELKPRTIVRLCRLVDTEPGEPPTWDVLVNRALALAELTQTTRAHASQACLSMNVRHA